MPNGYTAKLYEGEQSFTDFALEFARGYGLAIMMRDDDPGPIRIDRLEESTKWDERGIERADADIAKLAAMSDAEVEQEAKAEYEDRLYARRKDEENRQAIRARYEEMLGHVRAWDPPEGLGAMKDGMISQLEASIDFDCLPFQREPIVLLPANDWRVERMARFQRDREYHVDSLRQKRERNRERIALAQALFASLGIEAS